MSDDYKIIYTLPQALPEGRVDPAILNLPQSWNAVLLRMMSISLQSGLLLHAHSLQEFFVRVLDLRELNDFEPSFATLSKNERALATLDSSPDHVALIDHIRSLMDPIELPLGTYEHLGNELAVWRWICVESDHDR